ncbi:MAG: efflux RND transporter permease subunit [Caenispirillum sp.]|nr:efflux RND transporter permease subunit [Caenispirillum sp.]
MHPTDIFIKRPVLATVVSLLILLMGLQSLRLLNVREYPVTSDATITVQTAYVGASADLVQGFITTRLEQAVAGASGIDYITSTSAQGVSLVTAHLALETDPNDALAEINTKVNQVRNDLPAEAQAPTVDIQVGQSTASMYISFYSDELNRNQVTDYLVRAVRPELETVQGVQSAQILGARQVAMRIWLDPDRMASLGVTAGDVRAAIEANNVLAGAGSTKGLLTALPMRAETDIADVEQFRDLVIRETDGAIIRLADVADVELGAESYDNAVYFSGEEAVFMGITTQPGANALTVIADVREVMENRVRPQLPQGLNAEIVYDVTKYIDESITEVMRTIAEALVIVIVVIFLFLGSLRSVLIPAVAIPLSLIGAGFIMYALGYSLNVLTLLAMVLAIGLVVDDAIVVLENIHRHVEEGMRPYDAAIRGARELAGPVIAMTTTIIAVYAPIGFMGGLVGSLFGEFAFTLAAAVFISGIVALTLSPMMCAKILKPVNPDERRGFAGLVDRVFDRVNAAYESVLRVALAGRWVIVGLTVALLGGIWWMFTHTQSELAPQEDQGFIVISADGAPNASIDQMELWTKPLVQVMEDVEAADATFVTIGTQGGGGVGAATSLFGGISLKPWSERDVSVTELQPQIQQALAGIPGLDGVVFLPPSLPAGGGGPPVQFVIATIEPAQALRDASDTLVERARGSGLFAYVESDLKFDQPTGVVRIDRNRAADLGLEMRDLAGTLATFLSEGWVNRFALQGRSYKVIPQVDRLKRLNPEDLREYYVRARDGEMVPLGSVVSISYDVEPRQLTRFQQLNAATIQGVPAPGTTVGEALAWLEDAAAEELPPSYQVDYAGPSRQFVQEGGSLGLTFGLALLVIYLVLSAQYESFRDPIIILISVPTAIAGALLFLWLGFATINIYTQVGLITLIGLIAKHGILIVEFANKIQAEEDKSRADAVVQAAVIRLRPILMTALSMVAGVVPLLVATGAGAEARFAIGLVIAAGLGIGTLFTLFVVPAFYSLLAADKRRPERPERQATVPDGAPP